METFKFSLDSTFCRKILHHCTPVAQFPLHCVVNVISNLLQDLFGRSCTFADLATQIIYKFVPQILATGNPRDTQQLTWDRVPLHTVSVVLDFLRGTRDDSVMTHVTSVDIMTAHIPGIVPATLNVDFLKDKMFVMKPAA